MEKFDVKKIRPGVLLFIRTGVPNSAGQDPYRVKFVTRMVPGPSVLVTCEVLELDTRKLNILSFHALGLSGNYDHQGMSFPE